MWREGSRGERAKGRHGDTATRRRGEWDEWGESGPGPGGAKTRLRKALRRGQLDGVIRHRTGPRQSEAAAGLGAEKGIPLRWLDRAGFEPGVRVASPRI